MPMKISVVWHERSLTKGKRHDPFIYSCDSLQDVASQAGVYVFCRTHGRRIDPVYIGRAENLARRIEQQLNNVALMIALKNSGTGGRVLLIGEWESRQGQRMKRALPVIENALIKYAMTAGYAIVNDKGTKTAAHEVSLFGSRKATQLFPKSMKVDAR